MRCQRDGCGRGHASGARVRVAAEFCLQAFLLARSAAAVSIREVGLHQGGVDIRSDLPGPQEFHESYVVGGTGEYAGVGRPVLFPGAARLMPAYRLWTDEYLRDTYGSLVLDQVETEKRETRTKYPHNDWTVAEFLHRYEEDQVYAVATLPPGLNEEMYLLPPTNCGGYHRQMSANIMWFSNGGTRSVIHNDPQSNIHCMIAGEKHWMLWRPDSGINKKRMGWVRAEAEAENDPSFKDAYGAYVGRLDIDNVDLERYGGWGKLKWWNMTMVAGDCAYIPPAWFHLVESPAGRTISVHVWFQAMRFFQKSSCDKLQRMGLNVSDFLFRVGDCSYDEDNRKKTDCTLSEIAVAGLPRMDEL